MSTFYAYYPPQGGGSGSGVTIYATLSLFPPTAATGTLAVAADTGILYEFNGTAWVPIASNAAYTAALTPVVSNYAQYFTLSSTDITNKYITLSNTPTQPAQAQLTVLGGVLQIYGFDFTISGTQLSWAGTDLDGFLAAGDELFVFYY